MSCLIRRAARTAKPFARDESGSVTLSFLLWFPMFVFLFLAILDFAYAFTVNASMWHQTRVAARGLSMHHLEEAEAEALIRQGLSWSKKDYAITISETRHTVTVNVATPSDKVGITNTATRMVGGTWAANVTVLREPV